MMTDTIYALSTPPGAGGVAIVRLSGPKAAAVLEQLAGFLPAPRKAAYAKLSDGKTEIDRGVVLYFKAPHSFTGEDVAEFHIHGSRAVVDHLIKTLSAHKTLRLAEPGEFTRRAFENEKLDLTEAEAVADLIAAETQLQKQQALNQLAGHLSAVYDGWAAQLKSACAHLEADIDFTDEEDVPEDIATAQNETLNALAEDISAHLNDNHRGERLREGFQITIIGPPNAGKSSLLNALAQRDVAIVSDTAGTTRDVIEAHLNLGGYPVIVSDTAGLHDARDNEIETQGMNRALSRASNADLKILLLDAVLYPDYSMDVLNLIDEKTLLVMNKCDVAKGGKVADQKPVMISVKTGAGISELLDHLISEIKTRFGQNETPALTRQRHREALEQAHEALIRAQTATTPELKAEDVRLALRALGRITGRVDVEDMLDIIFRDFCIGK